MIINVFKNNIKEEIKHKYIKLHKKDISKVDIGFLFVNLWLLAIGDSTIIHSPELEDNLIPMDATDKDIEVITEKYIQSLKQDYNSEIELIKEFLIHISKNKKTWLP